MSEMQSSASVQSSPRLYYDDEIDLRAYLEVLHQQWLIVAGITVIAVLGAAVMSFFILPPVYEATAGVVLLQTRTQVAFEPKIRTERPLEEDIDTRREALQALVTSTGVAVRVLEQLQEDLPAEDRQLDTLLDRVSTPRLKGDLLEIQVRHTDPQKTATIANSWVHTYVDYVNNLFAQMGESPEVIEKQVKEVKEDYQKAQEDLVRFMENNQIEILAREISARKDLIASYKDTQTKTQSAIFNQQLETKQKILANYYTNLAQVEQLLADAKALQRQLESGAASPSAALGDALATMFLRTQTFASSIKLPVQLQLSMEEGSDKMVDQAAKDIKALITTLETRRNETQARIDQLSSELSTSNEYEVAIPADDPINQLVEQYSVEVLRLQAQLEEEEAQKRELTLARDLAWETYTSLTTKQTEVLVAEQVRNEQVRLAVEALVPEEPVSPHKVQNMVFAGILGLMLGVFAAFFTEFLDGQRTGNND